MESALIYGVVGFFLGFLIGFITRDLVSKVKEARSGNLIMLVVTIMWAASVAVDMLIETYETPLMLHMIMGGIVGYFFKFAISGIQQNKNEP